MISIILISDTPSARATVSRALQSEGVVVRDDGTEELPYNIAVVINGEERVRIVGEETEEHVRLIIQQIGIGMIDGQSSLQLLESVKGKQDCDVYGG